MSPPFAVIFDMDGVLINSSEAVQPQFVLTQSGIQLPDSERKLAATLPLADQLSRWNTQYGTPFSSANQKALSAELGFLKDVRLDPSLLWLLRDLSSNNVPCAVATSSGKERAEKLLTMLGLRPFFLAVLTSESAPTKKELFRQAASRLGLPPQQCVVIEDSPANIEAARDLGMKTVGFVSEPFTKEDLSGAQDVIESFSTLSTQRLSTLVVAPSL